MVIVVMLGLPGVGDVRVGWLAGCLVGVGGGGLLKRGNGGGIPQKWC